VSPGDQPRAWNTTAITAAAIRMKTMKVTTAEVVARPTAEALRPHCMPPSQPDTATIAP
jgi:hypothetical protein